jgi:integrase
LTFDEVFHTPEVKPLNSNFVKRIQLVLSSVFENAVKKQIMRENPMRLVTPPKKQEQLHTALTGEQAKERLERLKAGNNRTMSMFLTFIMFTGTRSGEARALTWDDINLDTGLVTAGKNVDPKKRVTEPKTKSSVRVIRLIDEVCEMLKEYKTEQEKFRESLGNTWSEQGIVFPNSRGSYMVECSVIYYLKRTIKGTAIPQTLTVHGLRHTFASLLISQGEIATNVSALLGHASTSATLNIYAHSFRVQQAVAMENIGNMLLDKKTAEM